MQANFVWRQNKFSRLRLCKNVKSNVILMLLFSSVYQHQLVFEFFIYTYIIFRCSRIMHISKLWLFNNQYCSMDVHVTMMKSLCVEQLKCESLSLYFIKVELKATSVDRIHFDLFWWKRISLFSSDATVHLVPCDEYSTNIHFSSDSRACSRKVSRLHSSNFQSMSWRDMTKDWGNKAHKNAN